MPARTQDELFDSFDDFDPLAVDADAIDQDDIDDDNPYDTVDFPTLRTMPDSMRQDKRNVYTPERQGGACNALRALMDRNPARRPVLLAMLHACEPGMAASDLTVFVDELQKDNRSVYAPMTLARMLERAGGLTLDVPACAEEREDCEQGVEYLEIKEAVDPVWTTTDEGRSVYEELSGNTAFFDIVMKHDAAYLDVYRAIMGAIAEHPLGKEEIDTMAASFPCTAEPRRFGGHFIDMLERCDAIAWKNGAWTLTARGTNMLAYIHGNDKEDRHA